MTVKLVIVIFCLYLIYSRLCTWIERMILDIKFSYYKKNPKRFLNKSVDRQKMFIAELNLGFDGFPEKICEVQAFVDSILNYKN